MSAKYVFGNINSITSRLHTLHDQLLSVTEHYQLTLPQLQNLFAVSFGWSSFDEMVSWQSDVLSGDDYIFVDAPNSLVAYERLKMEMRMTMAKAIVTSAPTEIIFTEIMELMDHVWKETNHVPLPKTNILDESYILDSIYIETIVPYQYTCFLSTHILPKIALNGGVLFCYDHDYEEQRNKIQNLGCEPLVLNTTKYELLHNGVQEVHLTDTGDVKFITELLFSLAVSQNIDHESANKAQAIIKAYGQSNFVRDSENPTEKMLKPMTTESLIAAFNSLDDNDKRDVTHCLMDIGVDVINGQAVSSSMVTIQSTPLGEMLYGVFELVARIFEPQSQLSKGVTIEGILTQKRPLMVVVSSDNDQDKDVACVAASAIRSKLLSRLIINSKTGDYTPEGSPVKIICLPHDADFLPNGFYNMVHLVPNLNYGIVAGGFEQRELDKDAFYSCTCRNVATLLANVDTLGGFLPKRQGISGLFKKREFQPALYSKRHAKNILSVSILDLSVESKLKESNIDVLLLK